LPAAGLLVVVVVVVVCRQWSPVSQWSKSAVRQLSLLAHTEDYEYNKVIVGDNTDPNLIWFVLSVSPSHYTITRSQTVARIADPYCLTTN